MKMFTRVLMLDVDSAGRTVSSSKLNQVGPAFLLRWSGCPNHDLSAVFSCECGRYTVLKLRNVITGKSRTCGYHKEYITREPCSSTRVRKAKTTIRSEYKIWKSMKARCNNPNHKSFSRYGGRGIRVCEEWSNSFRKFLSDVGDRPDMTLTLDRIDNNGNYEPGNVRWATRAQQVMNRSPSRNRVGVLCFADMAKRCGIPADVIKSRVRSGWPEERAILVPVRNKRISR